MRRLAIFALLAIGLATAPLCARAQKGATAAAWTGFYAGVSVGGRIVNADWTSTNVSPNLVAQGILSTDPNPGASFSGSSSRIGGYVGHDWLIAPAWIAGVEADIGYSNARARRSPIPGTLQNDLIVVFSYINQPMATVSTTWDGSLRGRIGYLASPDTLLFATTGAAVQRIALNGRCPVAGGATDWCTVLHDETFARTEVGWTIGGGVERMFGRWVARAEYRYADFGTVRHTFFTFDPAVPFDDRLTANVKVQTHTASLGLAYKFGGR